MIASRIPDRGESVLANEYLEALGGKGANSAIATYRTCHKKPLEVAEKAGDEKLRSSDVCDNTSSNGGVLPKQEELTIDDSSEDQIRVKMIGAVGDDRYGEKFIVELKKNGVDASGVVTNRCLFTLGATATWKREDFANVERLGGGARPDLVVAQMEIDRDVVEVMIETAGKAGIEFCLNAAPATPIGKRFYRHLTHLLVNESEAAIMSGRDRDEVNEGTWSTIAQEFLDRGVKNVVITLGAKGAFYANATGSDHYPAFEVKVEDTTGAGDTFTGAYASDYLRQKAKGTWDIRSAICRANKAAALTIQTVGAQDGIPWADEIDDFNAPHRLPGVARRTSSVACIGSDV
ncbi:hypothetical protein ACCO45_012841 [Purpureocillium lilacinum]|uniref:Uncharacterized protein n=1 Tax=Purpureocillium lilacinum TaxID=33203 RepID=A0ACC4DC81_PURLI